MTGCVAGKYGEIFDTRKDTVTLRKIKREVITVSSACQDKKAQFYQACGLQSKFKLLADEDFPCGYICHALEQPSITNTMEYPYYLVDEPVVKSLPWLEYYCSQTSNSSLERSYSQGSCDTIIQNICVILIFILKINHKLLNYNVSI